MLPIKSRLKYNIILALLIPLALIAPDFIAQVFNSADAAILSKKFLLGIIFFGLFLSFADKILAYFILGFFIFLELIQFGHLFYYDSLITSAKYSLLFSELDEVFVAAKEASRYLLIVPFVVLAPYGILIFLFSKFDSRKLKTKWAILPLLCLLAIIPYRVNKIYNGVNYYPDPADHSLRNSLYAFSNYILNITIPTNLETKYKEYKIIPSEDWKNKKANIVLIIGESMNPMHMSLFTNYKYDTNPMLSTLKNDKNFTYMLGLSSGVNTLVSVQLLLNGIYEPNNHKAIESISGNLFKLAKEHKFKTFFISAQSGASMTNIGYEYIDYIIFRQKAPDLFNKYNDEAFLKIIPDLDYAEKNFIVLHQRNIHAPYETNYSHDPKFSHFPVDASSYKQFLVDTYDNAVRFNDSLLYKIFEFYKNKFDGPTYIFFTPDHGEGVGDNNIWGHAFLNEQIYTIPFLSYIVNADPKINAKAPICHYEIHDMIAKILGFNIYNPNIKPDICYIQSTNLYGINEFVEFNKNQR
ncbi:MAG: phosphoethanolamine transferase [Pseudomonadota bacterium]